MPGPNEDPVEALGGDATVRQASNNGNIFDASDPENPKTLAMPAEEKANRVEAVSAFKSLGWLDRFLAVWILFAMVVGVLLGNFVPNVGPALQRGKFVGVSIPIGMVDSFFLLAFFSLFPGNLRPADELTVLRT